MLHRDIKPENILINEDCYAKICDFGLSRAVGNNIYYKDKDNYKEIVDSNNNNNNNMDCNIDVITPK